MKPLDEILTVKEAGSYEKDIGNNYYSTFLFDRASDDFPDHVRLFCIGYAVSMPSGIKTHISTLEKKIQSLTNFIKKVEKDRERLLDWKEKFEKLNEGAKS